MKRIEFLCDYFNYFLSAFLTPVILIALVLPLHAQPCEVISGYIEYNGERLPHIEVVLRGADGVNRGSDMINEDGHYIIAVDNPPSRYRLIFIAENDAAKVHPTLDPSPRAFRTELFDFPESGNCDRGIEDISSDFADPADPRDGIGLWMAGQVYQIREWFISATQSLGSLTPDPDTIKVPVQYPIAGVDLPGHYWGVGEGIHIDENNISAFYHEYGHFLSDIYASWIDIPDYGPPCTDLEHFTLCAMDCTVWPFFEGFAHLVGALSWIDIYGSLAATSTIAGNCPSWWIEDPFSIAVQSGTCSGGNPYTCNHSDLINNPELTEASVGATLYDLIDIEAAATTFDPNEPHDFGNFTFADIFRILTYEPGGQTYYTNPCNDLNSRPNPITLEHFWDAWRDTHLGPVPRLWSAFAQNHMADWDTEIPDPPTIISASHEIGMWSNKILIEVEYDQRDDAAGVWWYAVELDQNPATIPTAFVKQSGLQDAVRNDAVYTNCTVISKVASAGVGWYLHSQAKDQPGKKAANIEHYGPLYIDLDPPVQQVFEPVNNQTFLKSGEVTIEFEANDPGPDFSGIGKVIITYQDNDPNGITITIYDRDYSQPGIPPIQVQGPDYIYEKLTWKIPDNVPATTMGGTIRVEVFDVAGNSGASEGDVLIHIITLFEPDAIHVASVNSGDVACADFDQDGYDDLAYVGRNTQTGLLESKIMSSTGTGFITHTTLESLELGAVAWGDIDRNGLIDLVITGLASSSATETHIYLQSSLGVFTNVGSLNIDGIMNGDLELGDLDNNGDLDAVVIGEYKAGVGSTTTPHRKVYYFDDPNGNFKGTDLPWGEGNSTNAEVELIDYNGDTWLDISITGQVKTEILVGPNFDLIPNNPFFEVSSDSGRHDWGDRDGNGVPAIAIMAKSPNIIQPTVVWYQDANSFAHGIIGWWTSYLERGDVLWGDVDNDGDSDLLVMGSDQVTGFKTLLLANRGNTLVDNLEIKEVIGKQDAKLAWCDFDGNAYDGYDMDLIVMSIDGIVCYINRAASVLPNTPPEPPDSISVLDDGFGNYTFSWNPPLVNDATPMDSLTYDLQVGSTFGGADLFSGVYAVDHGNVGLNTQITLNLPTVGMVYWFVRAVDGGFKRSNSTEWAPSPIWPIGAIKFTALGQLIAGAENSSNVFIGIDPNASIAYSPVPPTNHTVFMEIHDGLQQDYRKAGSDYEEWKLNVRIGNKADPNQPGFFPVLNWNFNPLRLKDPIYGIHLRLYGEDNEGRRILLVPDMYKISQYQIKKEDLKCIDINQCIFPYYIVYAKDIPVKIYMPAGWNMFSLPVIPPRVPVSKLFPDAVVIYGYNQNKGYFRIPKNKELMIGESYWILLNEARTYTLIGQPIHKYARKLFNKGWRMIGGCSLPAKIFSDNSKIGVIYKYIPNIGYRQVPEHENIIPGRGYWLLIENVFDKASFVVRKLD